VLAGVSALEACAPLRPVHVLPNALAALLKRSHSSATGLGTTAMPAPGSSPTAQWCTRRGGRSSAPFGWGSGQPEEEGTGASDASSAPTSCCGYQSIHAGRVNCAALSRGIALHTLIFSALDFICVRSVAVPRCCCGFQLRMGARLATKWGSFEVRSLSSMLASSIRQHGCTTVHRAAARSFLSPGEPIVEFLQQQPGDEALLAGNVPQPEDWLRAWRACRTPSSFNALADMLVTEHFIRQVRTVPVARRAIKQLVAIMSEVTRSKKREVLRSAWSISLSLDDRKDYRLIRFRCDGADGPVCGILAVLRGGGRASTSNMEALDEDKSKGIADSIIYAIEQLCTPVGGTLD